MSDKENRVRTQSVCMKDKHVYIVYILHYISCIENALKNRGCVINSIVKQSCTGHSL